MKQHQQHQQQQQQQKTIINSMNLYFRCKYLYFRNDVEQKKNKAIESS